MRKVSDCVGPTKVLREELASVYVDFNTRLVETCAFVVPSCKTTYKKGPALVTAFMSRIFWIIFT